MCRKFEIFILHGSVATYLWWDG